MALLTTSETTITSVQSSSTPQDPISIKFVKGVPYYIDSKSNTYLFIRESSNTENFPRILIGKLNGDNVVLVSDWKERASYALKLYRETIVPFERTEHTKAVKYNKKYVQPGKSSGTSETTENTTERPDGRKKPRVKVQPTTGTNPRKSSKSAK